MPDTTDLAGTLAIIRARAEAQITTLPLYWQDEGNFDLRDEPAPFVFFELIVRRGRIAGFGAGRGANLYRTPAELNAHVFVPQGIGLPAAPPNRPSSCGVISRGVTNAAARADRGLREIR